MKDIETISVQIIYKIFLQLKEAYHKELIRNRIKRYGGFYRFFALCISRSLCKILLWTLFPPLLCQVNLLSDARILHLQ